VGGGRSLGRRALEDSDHLGLRTAFAQPAGQVGPRARSSPNRVITIPDTGLTATEKKRRHR